LLLSLTAVGQKATDRNEETMSKKKPIVFLRPHGAATKQSDLNATGITETAAPQEDELRGGTE